MNENKTQNKILNQNQKTIKVDIQTKEKIAFLAKALNQKQSNFLNELIDNLFTVACNFDSANISYMPCITSSYLYVQWTGKNRNFAFGKNQNLDDEIEKLVANAPKAKPRQTANKPKAIVIANEQ